MCEQNFRGWQPRTFPCNTERMAAPSQSHLLAEARSKGGRKEDTDVSFVEFPDSDIAKEPTFQLGQRSSQMMEANRKGMRRDLESGVICLGETTYDERRAWGCRDK